MNSHKLSTNSIHHILFKMILCSLFLIISQVSTAGFQPKVVVLPEFLETSSEIMVGLDPDQFPCLLETANFLGQTHDVEIIGNEINLTVIAVPFDPCFPIHVDEPNYFFYNIGELPEGSYNVTVFYTGFSVELPIDPDSGIVADQFAAPVPFQILGQPITVPSFTSIGLVVLLSMLLFFSHRKFRRMKSFIFKSILLLVFSKVSIAGFLLITDIQPNNIQVG